ncbi:MAG: hypothetical protein FJX22_01695 [Alphaproteobacteria bacterium]|nr:hypothetical protein [Alphaproteobacteria bacterium]
MSENPAGSVWPYFLLAAALYSNSFDGLPSNQQPKEVAITPQSGTIIHSSSSPNQYIECRVSDNLLSKGFNDCTTITVDGVPYFNTAAGKVQLDETEGVFVLPPNGSLEITQNLSTVNGTTNSYYNEWTFCPNEEPKCINGSNVFSHIAGGGKIWRAPALPLQPGQNVSRQIRCTNPKPNTGDEPCQIVSRDSR